MVCGAPCRQQLWINLLDLMGTEAFRIRDVMGLPEKDLWSGRRPERIIPAHCDTQLYDKSI